MHFKLRHVPLYFITVACLTACDKGVPEQVKFKSLNIDGTPIPGGACNFDSVAGKNRDLPIIEVERSNVAKYEGWAALSVEDSAIGKGVELMLEGENSSKFVVTASRNDRLDVANFFKKPSLKGAGFTVDASVSDVPPGDYVLSVLIEQDNKLIKCGITKKIIVK